VKTLMQNTSLAAQIYIYSSIPMIQLVSCGDLVSKFLNSCSMFNPTKIKFWAWITPAQIINRVIVLPTTKQRLK
jgi:hypothetical protein